MNVFLAHPKSLDEPGINAAIQRVQRHLQPGTVVVTGRADFEANFYNFGNSLKKWAWSVSERYAGIVIVPVAEVSAAIGCVGSATADIIDAAIQRGTPLMVLFDSGHMLPLLKIEKTTGRARDGWNVEVVPF